VRKGKYTIAEEHGRRSDTRHHPCKSILELTGIDHIFAKGEAITKT
jgi:hypothetical protein